MEGRMAIPLRNYLRLAFNGSDRVRFMNGQVTHDIKTLSTNDSRMAAICTAKGKMEGYAIISNDGNTLYADAPSSLKEKIPSRLERYIIADDVEMADISEDWNGYHSIGEKSLTLFDSIDLPEKQIFASKRFGLEGFDIWVKQSHAFEVNSCSSNTIKALRVEAALPEWEMDMNEKTLPPEANFDYFGISYSKGCYTGQEPIARIKSIGKVNKRLCLLSSDDPMQENTTMPVSLTAEDKEAGKLSSISYSPKYQKALALGMIKSSLCEPGTELLQDRQTKWEVLPLPYAS
ncbi:MAG: hypothetical protein AAF984_04175 [Verrucomicrobiota bacterium]